MEKYEKDGKVAVLVSPDFGAGWSTWNSRNIGLAMDKRVVEYWMAHKDDEQFFDELGRLDSPTVKQAQALFYTWGYEGVYFGGFNDIELVWLPKGTKFIITEYDGSENLVVETENYWNVA